MKSFLYVAFGGSIGAMLRYILNLCFKPENLTSFPWHTFTINSLGCLCIGVFFALGNKYFQHQFVLNTLVITGLLGAFTTFSSYSIEAVNLFMLQQKTTALIYVLTSNIAGIGLTFWGYYMVKFIG